MKKSRRKVVYARSPVTGKLVPLSRSTPKAGRGTRGVYSFRMRQAQLISFATKLRAWAEHPSGVSCEQPLDERLQYGSFSILRFTILP